jgi:hypothetical protein
MKKRCNLVTILGLVGIVVGISGVLPVFFQPDDIWWTPRQLALTPDEASGRVRILVADEPLTDRLAAGELLLVTPDGPRPMAAGDIRLRLNNRDKVRAHALMAAMVPVAIAAVGLSVTVFGLFVVPARREAQSVASQQKM